MDEEYAKRNYTFCPRCGLILRSSGYKTTEGHKCPHCRYEKYFEINPKWNITEGRDYDFRQRVKYGEITQEERKQQWEEICQPFIDEVIKKRPEFDPALHEHIPVWREERKRERLEREAHWQKLEDTFHFSEREKKNPTITCPYCKSTNIKKISAVSRGLSFSIFGFGSKKVGKQWHCNKCGSDF